MRKSRQCRDSVREYHGQFYALQGAEVECLACGKWVRLRRDGCLPIHYVKAIDKNNPA